MIPGKLLKLFHDFCSESRGGLYRGWGLYVQLFVKGLGLYFPI